MIHYIVKGIVAAATETKLFLTCVTKGIPKEWIAPVKVKAWGVNEKTIELFKDEHVSAEYLKDVIKECHSRIPGEQREDKQLVSGSI